MTSLSKLFATALIATFGTAVLGQVPAEKPVGTAPVEKPDATVDAAAAYIGRALFLRCFCAENNVRFDAQGKPAGSPKTTDWTLAGMNVQKVVRVDAGEVELDGVRVAIRYALDRREFDRKPQGDDKMRIAIADTGDVAKFQEALKAVFSVGIDRSLQTSMPDFWQHYFDPNMAWPADDLTGKQVYTFTTANTTAKLAVVTHKAQAEFTALANRDHVTGTVKLRETIDVDGVPRHISVIQPVGYGLDAEASKAASKYRFAPAEYQGKAVPSVIVMNEDFVLVVAPH